MSIVILRSVYVKHSILKNNININIDNYKHVAIIFHDNTIYAYGYNRYNENDDSEHAEHVALKNLINKLSKDKIKPKRFKMLVLRVHDNNTYSMSKPCHKCQKLLSSQSLIKRVYWTTNTNVIDYCQANNFN